MTDNFKITAHMVTSLDGFAAKKDNSVSWFNTADHYAKGVDAPDVEAFLKTIDCYIMGAHTYEHAIALAATYGWPYGEIPTIVVSNRNLPVNKPNIQLYSGNLDTLIHEQVRPKYNNVWVVGGPMLIKDCIRLKLVNCFSTL
jgi:dihydrofolate reductase